MESLLFVNWWFSWAASTEIDFRVPCEICRFEPKRLCCDGTKIGGFRNSCFQENNKNYKRDTIHSSLYRRMDRCFLKNMDGVETKQMITNRSTLDYLAKQTTGDLKNSDILQPDELNDRMRSLKPLYLRKFYPPLKGILEWKKVVKNLHTHMFKRC